MFSPSCLDFSKILPVTNTANGDLTSHPSVVQDNESAFLRSAAAGLTMSLPMRQTLQTVLTPNNAQQPVDNIKSWLSQIQQWNDEAQAASLSQSLEAITPITTSNSSSFTSENHLKCVTPSLMSQ
jgi:hypothetical protein